MSLLILCECLLLLAVSRVQTTEFEKVFEWKQISYADLPNERNGKGSAILFPRVQGDAENESFQPYNNIPMGATHYKDRLFITIPRRRPGVPATLNVIDLRQVVPGDRSPPLTAYPTYPINELRPQYEPDLRRLVSVYRTQVDACGRLWFVDTGMLEYPDNRRQVQRPQIWIVDLERDHLVRRFAIPESIVAEGVGMASITVDVEPENCDGAFAYVPDLVANAIYVYSMRADEMWAFGNHSSFRHDPTRAEFNVAG
ncbi:L-dopachrome tautomerase yellow-f2-like [Anopheles ziemanni]|uniref:L-dopachrome tautomerase yellow-f2-like n=1 Tax=Anopheles coustani TaxID=139045 RepID=UPI00265A3783|nr:L-dopachrome tautomerase yellow-f2-like [Anopheles coustani]XP_058169441.1 L-dopachrome tautomerase yellow-f2-like [Anopheles ziemanni]